MANINKNIIMQAGAAVANAANKAAGLSTSTPEPGSIISVIQLVNGGRTIGPEALAHFTESVRNKLLSLLVSMEPIQDFNGYGHPWPGGGGKNLLPFPYVDSTKTASGVTFTVNDDGTLTLSNTSTGTAYFNFADANNPFVLKAGTYTKKLTGLEGSVQFNILNKDGTAIAVNYTSTFTLEEDTECIAQLRVATGQSFDSQKIYPQIESGSVSTDFAPYSNDCPISGRTELHAYAGPTDSIGDAATYSMDWTSPAGTVYAGSADIVTGDIKSAPYYASYNGETLVGPWVSSMDVYDPEGTPTTGAQVVDLGGTMTEYHITGQDIITLVGDNYIWSDSGDVTITE